MRTAQQVAEEVETLYNEKNKKISGVWSGGFTACKSRDEEIANELETMKSHVWNDFSDDPKNALTHLFKRIDVIISKLREGGKK